MSGKKLTVLIVIILDVLLTVGVCFMISQGYFDRIDKQLEVAYKSIEAGDADGAGRAFERAVQLDKNNIEAKMGVANIAVSKGDDKTLRDEIYDIAKLLASGKTLDYTDRSGNYSFPSGNNDNIYKARSLRQLFTLLFTINADEGKFEINNDLVTMTESGGFSVYDRPQQPKANWDSGSYGEELYVSMSGGEGVFYTHDGTEPTISSEKYKEPIWIGSMGIVSIKAFSTDKLGVHSRTVVYEYEMDLPPLLGPDASIQPGTYYVNIGDLWLSNPNPIGTIYYTLDGTDPTENSPVVNGPIALPGGTVTVKTLIIAPDYNRRSAIDGFVYTTPGGVS